MALGAVLLLFTSLCMHHRTFYTMFDQSVTKLFQPNHTRNKHEQICDLIRLHSTMKE